MFNLKILLLSLFISKEKSLRLLNRVSEIKLTIKGKCKQTFIRTHSNETDYFKNAPGSVYVNEEMIYGGIYDLTFPKDENEVKVTFKDDVLSTGYMFLNVKNITRIDLSNFDASKVTYMMGMFFGCTSLTSINLTNFDTSSSTNFWYMFGECSSLQNLNLESFDTKSITTMNSMFINCISLKILDLRSFDTKNVKNMQEMFSGCTNLISLNLESLDVSSVTIMYRMFYNCNNLITLNIQNINISSVRIMKEMFSGCSSLITLDLGHFYTPSLTNMIQMFFNCNSLVYLNLENFDTSFITNMSLLFYNCTSLIELKINNFNTSLVKTMQGMFYECHSLKSLNLNHFDTSSVNDMSFMFSKCYSLEYLQLDNFNTLNVDNMKGMFYFCKSLISLNLDSFDTSNVINMDGMFRDCQKLQTLEIINFVSNPSLSMNQMFYNCYSLISLDLYNFKIEKLKIYASSAHLAFGSINQTLIYCINISSEDTPLNGLSNGILDCPYLCLKKGRKYINELKICIKHCSNHPIYQFEYENYCYRECENDKFIDYINHQCFDSITQGYYLKDEASKEIEKCPIKCNECSKQSIISNLCLLCNDDYYPIYNENADSSEFNNCFNGNVEGHYRDNISKTYKPCYSICKNCDEFGDIINNKCTECINGYLNINGNCSPTCPYYYFYNSSNEYQCTQDNKCPKDYSKLIHGKMQCITDCKDVSNKYEYKGICYEDCPLGTKKSNNYICKEINICTNETFYIIIETGECTKNCSAIDYFNYVCKLNPDTPYAKYDIANRIREDLLKGLVNLLLIPKVLELNEDLNVKDNIIKILYQLTSSFNQNNNNNKKNISIIKLGQCENILKRNYNLDEDDELIIFMIEMYKEGFLIPIVEYEVFNLKINEKLDLNMCNDTKIQILHPVDIDENKLFKYNSSDEYYNDICYPYTTGNNTDITLDDRQNEFTDNNMSLCEANCEYNGYNRFTKNAECECEVKTKITILEEYQIDKNLLLSNFKNIKNYINLVVLKCYKLLFTFGGFFKNIGNYSLLAIIFIDICCAILFSLKGKKILFFRIQKYIENIYTNRNSNNNIDVNKNEIKVVEKNNSIKQSLLRKDLKIEDFNEINDKIGKSNVNNNKNSNNNNNNLIEQGNPPKKIIKRKKVKRGSRKVNIIVNPIKLMGKEIQASKIDIINFSNFTDNKKPINSYKMIISNDDSKVNKINNLDNINYNYNYNDYELNNLEYNEALKFDKRSYLEYYISLIKSKQLLIFTFYTSTDYNSKILKISLFFFFLALYLTVNALFFNDESIHKIYVDKGKFNFVYQIPKILYSSLISTVINTIVSFLSMTEKNVIKLKKEEGGTKEKVVKFSKCLEIKFIVFFVLEFLFLLFFWYYISCFCAVYRNTQIHFFKASLMSFGLSLIYPFGICLIPGTLRFPAIRTDKKELECCYKLSKILQLF